MDVGFDISMEFVRLAGYTFLNNYEHVLMTSFLLEPRDITVARANEIMRVHRARPLTEGKNEELAEVI